MHNVLKLLTFILLGCSFHVLAETPQVREDREPEAATGFDKKSTVIGHKYMAASANPYATQAGYNILKKGGSAVDAAIATQLVLTLVEPQSSGIGGGTFMLHWDNKSKTLSTFNGRETAPKDAKPDLFMKKDGTPLKWIKAVVGGRSVGVPGLLAAMKLAHDKYGKLPWAELFAEAIELAENGFIVSPRLAQLVEANFNPGLQTLPEINQYFYPNGQAIKAGQRLKNPKLATVLKTVALEGIDVFYKGWIAEEIVNAVQTAKVAPGLLSMDDMKQYKAQELAPICQTYKVYNVCGMAPPSSGGLAVIQILKQLEDFNIEKHSPSSAEAVHLFTQSSRLAFADRDKYMADNDFVSVPTQQLISPEYIESRAKLIDPKKDMGTAKAGEIQTAVAFADPISYDIPSTSHISIVDTDGNAVSMTSSIEMGFGSAVMVNGFILNNQLTDFSLVPERNGQLVANRVEANKRPRSSMAPMLVLDKDNNLALVVGSPGGSRIINYVAQTILGILDWGLTPQQAINLPRITNRNQFTTLEKGTPLEAIAPMLESMGHRVAIKDLNSGLQAIQVKDGKLIGGADPRREGRVYAD